MDAALAQKLSAEKGSDQKKALAQIEFEMQAKLQAQLRAQMDAFQEQLRKQAREELEAEKARIRAESSRPSTETDVTMD